jgi:hypothetical protein
MLFTILRFLGRHLLTIILLTAALVGGLFVYQHFKVPVSTTIQTNPDTTTVHVDTPVVTEKVISRIIADPKDRAQIATLLAANKALALTVTQLTNTTATVKTQGGTERGGVVTTTPSSTPGTEATSTYKDWQLNARYTSKTFSYDLTQTYEIVTSTGTNSTGQRTELVKLYQIGPKDERIPVPAKTTAIFAETVPHWIWSALTVQGGIAAVPGALGGVVGVQWLKHGRTTAPSDLTFAVATPVVFVSSGIKELGVLPVSFNLGSLPTQPFTNLWVSPYLSRSQAGVTVTATF